MLVDAIIEKSRKEKLAERAQLQAENFLSTSLSADDITTESAGAQSAAVVPDGKADGVASSGSGISATDSLAGAAVIASIESFNVVAGAAAALEMAAKLMPWRQSPGYSPSFPDPDSGEDLHVTRQSSGGALSSSGRRQLRGRGKAPARQGAPEISRRPSAEPSSDPWSSSPSGLDWGAAEIHGGPTLGLMDGPTTREGSSPDAGWGVLEERSAAVEARANWGNSPVPPSFGIEATISLADDEAIPGERALLAAHRAELGRSAAATAPAPAPALHPMVEMLMGMIPGSTPGFVQRALAETGGQPDAAAMWLMEHQSELAQAAEDEERAKVEAEAAAKAAALAEKEQAERAQIAAEENRKLLAEDEADDNEGEAIQDDEDGSGDSALIALLQVARATVGGKNVFLPMVVGNEVRNHEVIEVEDCLEEDTGTSSQPGDRYFPSTDPAWAGRSGSRHERRLARRGGKSGYSLARDGNLLSTGDEAGFGGSITTAEDRRVLQQSAARRVFGHDSWGQAVKEVYSMSATALERAISQQLSVLVCLRARRTFVSLCTTVAKQS